jgi:LysR family transcriptional regulator (chromosome initiation inhibitor)
MELVHPQLSAFLAVLEEGSFDAGAKRLAVTASAISQRIKALEDRLGQVLVVRASPCRPTPAGERLLRRVRPMQALEAEALADFMPAEQARTVAIAVNTDSLEIWVLEALAQLHHEHGYLFDVRVDDQEYTLDLLRQGAVLGAITAKAKALQGCNVRPLGTMRYRAIASPALAAKHFAKGVHADAFATAPMIVFDRKDDLQTRFVRRYTRARVAPPVHYLPSSTGFVEAAVLGLGWCLAAEPQIGPALAAKKLVLLDADTSLDVPLYWQYAAVQSTVIDNVGKALRAAAKRTLR